MLGMQLYQWLFWRYDGNGMLEFSSRKTLLLMISYKKTSILFDLGFCEKQEKEDYYLFFFFGLSCR